MKRLILYYSWSGATREAARAIAEAVEGDLLELTEKGRRKGAWGFIKGGFQASFGLSSRIREALPDPKAYDSIYIGTPVWASGPSAAFNAVVKAWAGKTGETPVHVFALMADPEGNDKVETAVRKKLKQAGIKTGSYAWFAGIIPNREWPPEDRERVRDAAARWAAGVAHE